MNVFRKRLILFWILLMTWHPGSSQSFTISGPTCVLPNVPYTYTFSGGYPSFPGNYSYVVGGSMVGLTSNTITIVWQGSVSPSTLTCYYGTPPVTISVLPSSPLSNSLALSSYNITNNVITGISVTSSDPGGCGYSYYWEDAGAGPYFRFLNNANSRDYTVSGSSQTAFALRRTMWVTSNTSVTAVSNIIGLQVLSIVAGQDAGTLTPSPVALCSSSPVYSWDVSTDGSSWTNFSNSTVSTYSPGVLTSTHYYRLTAKCGSGAVFSTTVFKVNVSQPLAGGTVSGPATSVTPDQLPGDLVSQQPATGGGCSSYNYQWQQSLDGVNFTSLDNAFNGDKYSPDNIYQTTYFRRMVSCTPDVAYSNTVVIHPILPLNGGIVNPGSAFITSSSPSVNFSSVDAATGGDWNSPYGYQWQKSSDGTNFTDIDGATGLSYQTPSLDAAAWYRRKVSCNSAVAYSNIARAVKSDNENYVREFTAVKPGMADNLEDYADNPEMVHQSTSYFDGLGRPVEMVERKQSLTTGSDPQDQVTLHQYDAMGREAIHNLPFASASTDGLRKLRGPQQQTDFYNGILAAEPEEVNIGSGATNWAFGKTVYETSPLSRTTETFSPGVNWAGTSGQVQESGRRSVKTKYLSNQDPDGVRIWTVTGVAGGWATYSSPGIYTAGTLTKTITVDEQGAQAIEFKDLDGELILKKTQLTAAADDGSGSGHSGWLCTYYVYDDLQQLRAVIQPSAVDAMATAVNWSPDATMLGEAFFRYEYDGRRRVIWRKSPGAGVAWTVYDALDRPVLTQDANQRGSHQWQFNKYDAIGRLVMTGLYTDNTHLSQSDMQTYMDAQNTSLYESATTGGFPFYSLSGSFPSVGTGNLLTVDYYDGYGFQSGFASGFGAKDNSYDGYFTTDYSSYPYATPVVQAPAVNGELTGHWDHTGAGILDANFYDDRGLVIQTRRLNFTGGIDVKTTQYSFTGLPLTAYVQSDKAGNNAQTTKVLSVYSYDDLGRVTKVSKKTGNTLVNGGSLPSDFTVISQSQYDALGRVSLKSLGSQKDGSGVYTGVPLENLRYEYNIRGWLLGMNRDYLSGSGSEHFGFELAYDKQTSQMDAHASALYAASIFNGSISGMLWRSAGDGEKRKYDFTYDQTGRLTGADFNQYTNNAFNKDGQVDFSVSNLAYDQNGNITKMQQMGLKGAQSDVIDNLAYTYYPGGNRLKNVRDANNDATGTLGDFKTSLAHPQKAAKDAATTQAQLDQITDYTYDNNGNLLRDYNKDIGDAATDGITYNYQNLPVLVSFKKAGAVSPSTIAYTYDANGLKLQKIVTDNTGPSSVVTTTLYLDGMVYSNDVLQFVSHEEGKTRYTAAVGSVPAKLDYDYFIKDHLGNVRMVLTDEQEKCTYPAATLEGSISTDGMPNAVYKEKDYYTIDPGNIVDNPDPSISYFNNNGITNTNPNSDVSATSQKMYQLQATGDVAATGLGITLKVMSGDQIDIFGKSYYNVDNSGGTNSPLSVGDLLTGLLGGPSAIGAAKGVTATGLSSIPAVAGAISGFLTDPQRGGGTKPKAYVNYILLDDQFHYAGGGFSQVGDIGLVKDHYLDITMQNIQVVKNGYLYVYCSNESPVKVFFDNLQVVHRKGALLEETHYYPFGLTMAGISDKAMKGSYKENKHRYNGKELQNREFADGSGWEEYDFGARYFDPQIGRWHGQDKFSEVYGSLTPYQYAGNNPLKIIDEGGHLLKDKDGNIIATSNANAKVIDQSYTVQNKDGSFSQRTIKLKEVTVYTDAGTAVQAYQVIGAMVADAVDDKGTVFGAARPTPISKNMKANCLGYAFADGQVWFIDNTSNGSEFQKILNDEYVEVEKPDANVAVIEWSSVGDFVRAHAGKVNKDGTYDHKDEIFAPVKGDDLQGFMQGHDSGNGVYKVGTKYYKKKTEDKKADLPSVTVDGVRIVDEDQIKQILDQLGIGINE